MRLYVYLYIYIFYREREGEEEFRQSAFEHLNLRSVVKLYTFASGKRNFLENSAQDWGAPQTFYVF